MSSDFTRNRADAIVTRNTRRAFSAVKVAIASLVAVAVAVAVFIDVSDLPEKNEREREKETEHRFKDEQKGRRMIGLNGLSKYGLTLRPKFKVLGYVYAVL